jgi:hypothetical protein
MQRLTICTQDRDIYKIEIRMASYNKWDHKRNKAVLDKLKLKPVIHIFRIVKENGWNICTK